MVLRITYGVIPLKEWMVGDTRTPLLMLLSAVGSCLLDCLCECGQSAAGEGLRAVSANLRRGRLSARVVGMSSASCWLESLLLSLSGGLLGVFLGYAGVRLLLTVNIGGLPRLGRMGRQSFWTLRVLLFTLGVSLLTGIVFGLVPAVSASRPNLVATLSESGSRTGTGFRSRELPVSSLSSRISRWRWYWRLARPC